MEKWTGNFIKRVIDVYSRALDKFLDRAWLTIPILLTCILGLWFFFTHLPFTLLPPGDSGFARGVFIAQEGSSPEQMRAFQKLVNEKIEADPSVGQFFTVAGSLSRSSSSQAIIFCVFKPREQRDPIEQCLLRIQKSINTIPGLTAVITPSPVLQINVGATTNPGPVRLHDQRDRSARRLWCGESNDDEPARFQRLRFGALRLLQQHAEPQD